MDLESAIQHLKESLADPTHEWGCEECKQEHEQLLEWLEEYNKIKEYWLPSDEEELRKERGECNNLYEKIDIVVSGLYSKIADQILEKIGLERKYKCLEADYIEFGNRLRTANTENEELKRLLRLAVEDFQNVEEVCVGVLRCGVCPANNNCKWKHHDEAMKLIGGAENAEN